MKFKNKLKMRLGIAIVYVIIGVLLVVLTSIGIIKNEAMLVFGTAFGTCGLVMIVKNIRIFKSTENFIEIAEKDERNIMIWTKARSLTFSVYAVIAGIAIIVLYTVNMEYAAQVIAYNLCGVLVIYWICYFIIRIIISFMNVYCLYIFIYCFSHSAFCFIYFC